MSHDLKLDLIRAMVRPILTMPFMHDRKWQVQGLGMLRTYINNDTRLHIWDERLNYCADSGWHSHPWDFRSLIVSGRVTNREYFEEPVAFEGGAAFTKQHIVCGPGGCAISEPEDVWLWEYRVAKYTAGQEYMQLADDIHSTETLDGTISIISRKTIHKDGSANVYFPHGSAWSSAEARPATNDEILNGTALALERLTEEERTQ